MWCVRRWSGRNIKAGCTGGGPPVHTDDPVRIVDGPPVHTDEPPGHRWTTDFFFKKIWIDPRIEKNKTFKQNLAITFFPGIDRSQEWCEDRATLCELRACP